MYRPIDRASASVCFLVEDLKQAARESTEPDVLLHDKLIKQAIDLRNGIALARGDGDT